MINEQAISDRLLQDTAIIDKFLDCPDANTFTDVFNRYRPKLIAFFRDRRCAPAVAEDLAQDVMFKVYRKASQVRNRKSFQAWLFKAARNALYIHFGKQKREVETVDLELVAGQLGTWDNNKLGGTPAFEFLHWLAFLESHEREVMKLRFVEAWEYHEIAAKQAIPIGTVQWRVHNAKKKLAPHLAALKGPLRKAA